MADLANTFLALPSPPLADLARHKVDIQAAWKVGGVRLGKGGNWIVGVFVDPPSIWRDVPEPILEDFVAFNPAEPGRFRTVYGAGVYLGEAAHREAIWYRVPLPIFRSPLSWLQSGGAGVVPLDLAAFARSVIGCGDLVLVGEDLQHAKQIKQAVTAAARLALPKFRIAA